MPDAPVVYMQFMAHLKDGTFEVTPSDQLQVFSSTIHAVSTLTTGVQMLTTCILLQMYKEKKQV